VAHGKVIAVQALETPEPAEEADEAVAQGESVRPRGGQAGGTPLSKPGGQHARRGEAEAEETIMKRARSRSPRRAATNNPKVGLTEAGRRMFARNAAARRIAAKGKRLLKRYERTRRRS